MIRILEATKETLCFFLTIAVAGIVSGALIFSIAAVINLFRFGRF